MYNFGSSARELDYMGFNEVSSSKSENKEAVKKPEKSEKIKRKAFKYIAIAAVLLGVLMARDAQIDRLCGQITKAEDDIEQLGAILTEKQMEISGQKDINLIEKEAMERLNMVKPTEDMFTTIVVEKHDGGEVLTEDSTQTGGFAAFINKARILLEYLY